MSDFFTQEREERVSRQRMLPMLPPPRPVDPKWTCQKSGECCTIPREVVMTKQEAARLVAVAPPTITLDFRPTDHDDKVAMKTGPCPLFIFHTCVVYGNRPYSCRRFGCMRPDPKSEPFEEGGPLGCFNLSDRVATSNAALKRAKHIQKKAQGWARRFGWFPIVDGGA